MKLRWFIDYDGERRLQYFSDTDNVWLNVETVYKSDLKK
jgi:hypothetical protein